MSVLGSRMQPCLTDAPRILGLVLVAGNVQCCVCLFLKEHLDRRSFWNNVLDKLRLCSLAFIFHRFLHRSDSCSCGVEDTVWLGHRWHCGHAVEDRSLATVHESFSGISFPILSSTTSLSSDMIWPPAEHPQTA